MTFIVKKKEEVIKIGWKTRRPRIKLAKGVYLNFNKNGRSLTTKNKYVTRTTNLKTGATRTTVRTPIKGVSYTTTSGATNKHKSSKKQNQSQKNYSPSTYKLCGWTLLIVGIVASLLGLISFVVGGFIFLIFGVPMIALGIAYIKRAKEITKENSETNQN